MPQTVIESTTQHYLDIYDITDDVIILKDGSTAMVLTVNAMNFGLLAEPEQDAIMYAYAGLLNSLNYPIQIVIRSQTKDVTSYLQLLKDEESKITSDTRKRWISRYREFVADLIKERNVLDKKFYVVVSASSLDMGLLPPSSVLPGSAKIDLSTIERSVILEKAKEILEPRRDHLLGQLGRIGLYGYQLATQEIIQLFYLSYNPEAAEGQQITDTQSYTTPLVQASVQGGFMDIPTQTTAPVAPPTPPTPPAPPAPATPAPAVEPVQTAVVESPVTQPNVTPTPSVQPPTVPPTPSTLPAAPTIPTGPTPAATTVNSTSVVPPVASPTPPVLPTPTPTPLPVAPTMGATPVVASTIPSIAVPQNPGSGSTAAPGISSPTPDTTPSLSAAPPVTAAPPTAPLSPAPADDNPSSNSSDIASIQNEINSTLQQLGDTPAVLATEPAPTTPTATKPVTAGPNTTLPPLPEI